MHVFYSSPIVHLPGSKMHSATNPFITNNHFALHVSTPHPSHVQVILPSNFSYTCSDSTDCGYDDVLVMTSYFSPGSRSVPVIMAVVNNADHLLSEEPQVKTDVISGELLQRRGGGCGIAGGCHA